MSNLQIYLLGNPRLTLDDVPLHIPTARAIPLLAYLAITEQSQNRQVLANFLWPESSQKQALAALRTTLWRLKISGLEEWLVLDRNEINLNHQKGIEIDAVNFKLFLQRCNSHGHPPSQVCLYCTAPLTEAIDLYQGEFMSGFDISKAPTFDDWRMQQSVSLHILYLNALERLVRCHRSLGDFNRAIHYTRIWISHDHLNEDAYFKLLQLYSITGQRTAGITLYKHYQEMLSRELDIQPTDEMTALYKQIQAGNFAPPSNQKVNHPVFLIADIENAAQYWALAGKKKSVFLTAYTNIIKETSRQFGGRILQRSDDSMTLLFENGQPLHCAVTIHMKLSKTEWEASGPPNIRMVLYSTMINGDRPNNFSLLTRTASALLSISSGGQIVFTDQTLPILDLPSGAQVKDLGFHFLHDIDELIHVYELNHPNLPLADHPPLQTRTQQLVNFPVLSPTFIGREQELDELSHMMANPDNRIISLVGPGGVGKTRLAVQFASQVAQNFPDGVYFINLASIQDPQFIPIIMAEVLKFSFYGVNNQVAQLAKYLHQMKALLVFDNFEHLRGEGAKLLSIFLNQTHHLKLLVTTRERLNLLAESIMEVRGLPVPATARDENAREYSSVRLFLHNAHKVFPRFSYQNNDEAIIQICQLMDGIPLGILLASTWVKVFNCSEIASEIKKNINFLTTNVPDLDPRHRSLEAVFDNSWKLLSPEERKILPKLSIFKTAFSVDAAKEICDAAPLQLATFADKSLLTHQQVNHYEMLTTFNQYASVKLAEAKEDLEVTIIKYCEYYAKYCQHKFMQFNTSDQTIALAEMITEMENIRTAWNSMIDIERWDLIDKAKESLLAFHVMVGNPIQGRELFRYALLKLNRLNDPQLELIHITMKQLSAWMMIKLGFIAEGLQQLTECIEIFRTHQLLFDVALTSMFLAEANITISNFTQAKGYITDALEILQDGSINKTNYVSAITANCLSILGVIFARLGDYDQARENMHASLTIHQTLGTNYGTIHPLIGLGRLAYSQGEFIQARDLFLQAMETATKIYDRRGLASLHNNLAAVYEMMANISESYHHVTYALKFSRETGDRHLTAVILNNLAFHQLKYLHQPTEAIRTYQECIVLFSEISDLRGVTYSCYDLSKVYLHVRLIDEAWNYSLRALHTAMTLDSTSLILHTLHGFAHLYAGIKRYDRALRLCNLIIDHPNVDPDTQKRAIVTRAEIEPFSSPEIIQAARSWGENADLQDIIDQVLSDKYR